MIRVFSKMYLSLPLLGAAIFLASGCSDNQQPKHESEEERDVAKLDKLPENAAVDAAYKNTTQTIPEPSGHVIESLDPDKNGLYDDDERLELLEAIHAMCPDYEVPADKNGDGAISILEQTEGRDPITMLIGECVLASKDLIPWAINAFPEWITTAFFQEELPLGKVSSQTGLGTAKRVATQDNPQLQPAKVSANSGVVFSANSGQYLTMDGMRDSRWNYRWTIMTFRINGDSGEDETTVLLDVNKGKGPGKSSPKIWYDKTTGLNVEYLGKNIDGLDRRVMRTTNIATDGKTWNVIVCGIRYGQMFASVNGVTLKTVEKQLPRFSTEWAENATSYIGSESMGNSEWAYDSIVFGLTEPSEAMVKKMTGWAAHRLDFTSMLPDSHPYKDRRPVVDKEDFPHRYVHDNAKWTEWGESLRPSSNIRVHAGEPVVKHDDFVRVFYDDFRTNRVMKSTSGEGDLWVGSGFNVAVGVDAQLIEPGEEPNAYPYDAENQMQLLSLVQQSNGKWRGSAIYSVNDLGYGYTWSGPKIFRIRCKFPKESSKEIAGGLFPAFWSYSPEFIFWRTSNRIEADWFEFDGQNGWWFNGIASHYHYSHLKSNIFAKNPGSYKSYKVFHGEMKEDKMNTPGGLYVWDGEFHTWEFVVDEDMTYINVTIKDEAGDDKWIELARCRTAPTYLEELFLLLDYALKGKHGKPKDGIRQDFIVDWVEVLQPEKYVESVPEPFEARPQLTGSSLAGSVIVCDPNLSDDITDIRYFWYADGYPLTYGPDNTYKLKPEDVGKSIRCRIKAVGAVNQPEAWSNVL